MVVRPARPEDAAAVGDIHATSWAAAYSEFFDPQFAAAATADRRTRWATRVVDTSRTLLLAEVQVAGRSRPLAFSWSDASPPDSGAGEVYGFYNHPDGWGTGVAAELMTATLGRLAAAGLRQVRLWTLRDTPRSRRFYVKSGFVETGATRQHDYGDGAPLEQVEYARPLAPPSP